MSPEDSPCKQANYTLSVSTINGYFQDGTALNTTLNVYQGNSWQLNAVLAQIQVQPACNVSTAKVTYVLDLQGSAPE